MSRAALLSALLTVLLPRAVVAQPPAPARIVASEHDAWIVRRDATVLHRTDATPAWETLPPLPPCAILGRDAFRAPHTTALPDGLVVADGACVAWWRDGAWTAERISETVTFDTEIVGRAGPVLVAVATEFFGAAGSIAYSAFHHDGAMWRSYPLPSAGEYFHHLGGAAPDAISLVRSDLEPERDRSLFFDGRRWRARPAGGWAPMGAGTLPDGRIYAVLDGGLAVGGVGSWAVTRAEGHGFYGDAWVGDERDGWLLRRAELAHWVDGERVATIAGSLGGMVSFAGALLGVTADGTSVVTVDGGRLLTTTLSPTPLADPAAPYLAVLDVPPVPPDPGSPRPLGRALDSVGIVRSVGSIHWALVPTRADAPDLDCAREHAWRLARFEGTTLTQSVLVSDVRCDDTSPLVTPALEVGDLDADGRPEVSARFPIDLRPGADPLDERARVVVQVIADATDLRIEGAAVVRAEALAPSEWSTQLYSALVPRADGSGYDRPVARHGRTRRGGRAPRLTACARDAATDTFTCPGTSLEAGLGIDDVRPFALPASAPRSP